MTTYNPFSKPLDKVDKNDLEILKNISEGWYVEYKSIKLNGQKIAKSISSFANSHGGLYFIGIEGDVKTNCAKAFIGVTDSPDIIRDSLRGNLSPIPFFETHVISLDNGNHVIMVEVPEGENPPYINSDGKIYKRVGSASDPIDETNRLVVDDMYNRAKDNEERVESFRNSDLGLTNLESEFPTLEIYVNTRPFSKWVIEDFDKTEFLSKISDTKTIKGDSESIKLHIPFDTVSTIYRGISIRQMNGKDLSFNGLTFELDTFGNAKFFIPLENLDFSRFEECLKSNMSSISKRYSNGIDSIHILDGNKILLVIVGLLNIYEENLALMKFPNNIEIKFRLSNCHRTFTFFEEQGFVDYIEHKGLPICMKDSQYFPERPLFISNEEIYNSQKLIRLFSLSSMVLEALGIPYKVATTSCLEYIKGLSRLPSYNPSY